MLVFSIAWVMSLEHALVTVFGHGVSGRDLIMMVGGLYLLYHSVKELVEKVRRHRPHAVGGAVSGRSAFAKVIATITVMDLVFSLDSVMTAIGLVDSVMMMAAAIVASVVIVRYIEQHPELQILALSFLILISVLLLADGCGQHIPKGYVYFAMVFSFAVTLLQMGADAVEDETSAS